MTFDPALAMKTARRIRNIEPVAAQLLEAAVEAFAQEHLELADLEIHRARYVEERYGS